ncbi:hypothetical protein CF15_03975 [Pyrodictium occultum]|uniref:Uncharacterized protein n=1 Tax=Pyrodictium occultum TaxID=2309 RepID=A0A0V8RV77_PYROC|nr:hypothetical protein [Pyrodictium occultum]KSW11958.1 hypothetical protein CF15_03975 [Pyrodictium occultum]
MKARERRARALAEANEVLLPLLGGARALVRVLEAAGRSPARPVSLHSSGDKRLHALILELPGSSPLVVAVYSSTQESRPTSPQQLAKRMKRLAGFVARLRGRYFNAADVAYIYISPRGLTRGARRLAIGLKTFFAQSGREARQKLAKFLATRYYKLLASLRGKRVWGPVPLLLYALSILAQRLGAHVEPVSAARAIELSTRGGFINAIAPSQPLG